MIRVLGVVVVAMLVVAACGRDDDGGSGGAGSTEGTGGGGGGAVTAGPGFDGTNITVGALTPQTGIAAVLGNPLTAGNQVYFDRVNAQGGIAGRYPVRTTVLDTKYEPQTALQQYQASKASVAMYVQVLGTQIVDALLPQLATDRIMAGPASLDAFWVREPDLMPIGGPYQVQVINGMDYAMRNFDAGSKVVCALTKDDPYGDTGLAGLDFAASQYGFQVASRATFAATDQDFTAQINQLQGAGCQIVVLVSLPNESLSILSAAAGRGFAPMWMGVSPTWVSVLATGSLGPYMQQNFTLLAEGPQWGDTSVPGMAQMLADVQQFKPDQAPDIYFAFGYAQAWAASQIMEKAVQLGDLSPQGIIDASEQVGELMFGGLVGDYQYGPAADRNPPRMTTVYAVDPAVPGALRALQTNFASQAAQDYQFEG